MGDFIILIGVWRPTRRPLPPCQRLYIVEGCLAVCIIVAVVAVVCRGDGVILISLTRCYRTHVHFALFHAPTRSLANVVVIGLIWVTHRQVASSPTLYTLSKLANVARG